MTVHLVEDVPNHLALVTGQEEVAHLLDVAGVSDEVDGRVGVFVDTGAGDIQTLYVYPGHVPTLSKPVRRLV